MLNKTRYNNFNKALDYIEKAVKNNGWVMLGRSKYGMALRLRDTNNDDKLVIVYDHCSNKIHLTFYTKYIVGCCGRLIEDIKDASVLKGYVSKIMQFSETGKVVTMIHNINIEKSLDEL